MYARAWHKKTPPAARPSMGSCISNKRRLKAVFCKNSVWGLLKFTKNKRLLSQKQWMILGNGQTRPLGKALFYTDCERTKDAPGANVTVIFASYLLQSCCDTGYKVTEVNSELKSMAFLFTSCSIYICFIVTLELE